ncbi:MAG: DUF3822 family protein [Bacteroidales bacterium]|jgi:hypothetical protein
MITKTISLIDQPFHISVAHWLAVRISESILEYCVFDSSEKMIVAIESWNIDIVDEVGASADTLGKIKSNSVIINNEFARTIIIPDNPVYTFIPDNLFVSREAKRYLEFTHTISASEMISIDNIAELAVKNIYMFPFEADSFLRKSFSKLEYRHIITILVKTVLKNKALQDKVLINFGKHRMDIVIAMAGKLKFCNSFRFETHEDMLYFLLNVYKQLGFNTNIMPVLLEGDIEKESSKFQLIYKYIRNVSLTGNTDNIKFAPLSAAILPHRYFTLFNSFACE